ncbi:hypothetical protein QFC19_000596 [Naganishia cerealis]|uniref:Uncharacterized protein n=1 Tax=Naganishia cerealis TaxID=610337 RepID=A0ACC2WPW1_9TREE|nr:hypothetical protein QFC19_000596 [Naganishia cerealis]
MTINTSNGKETPPDYEALNSAFYSIVDSLFPKDFGQKGVKQTDADVLMKIRKAKEKERHRASNTENGTASTSSIPHANLLKRKLQSGEKAAAASTGLNSTAGGDQDGEESEEESRTRSLGKKTKIGHDAFSKLGKSKSKGKQKQNGSGLISKISLEGQDVEPVSDGIPSKAQSKSDTKTSPYLNPFAMPSVIRTTADQGIETESEAVSTIPFKPIPMEEGSNTLPNSTLSAAELSKNQRKKQRKKEKKALAKAESAQLQVEANGKLAIGQS